MIGKNHQNPLSGRPTKPLDTGYFLPDERTFSDLLKFTNLHSRHIRFYDLTDNPDGDWYDFFVSDEVFLLAEIDSYPLQDVEKKRIDILISFENQGGHAVKMGLTRELFDMVFRLLRTINDWYVLSSKYNRNRESTLLELELTSAIEDSARGSFHRLKAIREAHRDENGGHLFHWREESFSTLWRKDDPAQSVEAQAPPDGTDPDAHLLKQLMLVLKPVYDTMSQLIVRANRLLEHSLDKDDRHQPHIGLFLAFLKLYRYVQDDINRIPERQLAFYFEEILGQRRRRRVPDRMMVNFRTDPGTETVFLKQGAVLLAGQNAEGELIRYALERDVRLYPLTIAETATLFVSRNSQVDQNTRFQMVSGVYARALPYDPASVESWSTLGGEQRFLPADERTMDDARIGFVIASPVLRLWGGERTVRLEWLFTDSSFHFLTTILMDISNARRLKPDEVFYSVFTGSIRLEYTSPEGWVAVEDFRFLPPEQWDACTFTLEFKLGRSAPPLSPYAEAVHRSGLSIDQPAIRVVLLGANAYHPYSHLQFLELREIGVNVSVQDLRNLVLHSSSGPLDDSGPFEILGATPRKGSFLLVGNEEVFSKRLDELQIGWHYHGLPLDEKGLKGYYSVYPYGITNKSFKLRVSALSDFRFHPRDGEKAQVVDMFESDGKSTSVKPSRLIEGIDLQALNIRHRYDLEREDLEDYNSRKELGYIKLELTEPSMGFGYEVFSKVYNSVVTRSIDVKAVRRGVGLTYEPPREPFTPMVENLYVNYSASSTMRFTGSSAGDDTAAHDSFIHLQPFGTRTVFSGGKVTGSRLLPYFDMEGSLFIGLSNAKPLQAVSLLFDLELNDKWTVGKGPEIQWRYLSKDQWKPFKPERILFDETNGMINSGIICLELPVDITDDNESMRSGLHWISAGAKQKAELVSRIRRIFPNAASASYVVNDKDPDHPVSLPAESVQSLELDVPGVLSVTQPLSSVNGRLAEGKEDFNQRVSEILRHKNRAITGWDIEKMLLRNFDWLSVASAFGHMGNEAHVPPGRIVVAALPKIKDKGVFHQPLLNPGQILQMEEYLKDVSSPFAEITVRNPVYEYIWFKCKIMLNTSEVGVTLKRLHQDMLSFVCPWFYGDPQEAMNRRPLKKSEILNFIQTRPYVAFVTGFSVVQMKIDDEGRYRLKDSAGTDQSDEIACEYPWSILIPMSSNNIELIPEPVHHVPETSSLNDLVIGSNLIIGQDIQPVDEADAPSEPITEEAEKNADKYWFTLKI
jgi:hypothetical protein